jgi:hypothetical protein
MEKSNRRSDPICAGLEMTEVVCFGVKVIDNERELY